MLPVPSAASRRGSRGGVSSGTLCFVGLFVLAALFLASAALVLERSSEPDSHRERFSLAEWRATEANWGSQASEGAGAGAEEAEGDELVRGGFSVGDEPLADNAVGLAGGTSAVAADGGREQHPEPECAALIRQTDDVMFMIIGGRGYHHVRVRVMLRSWARCVRHVLVFTDPSLDVREYLSPYRSVYLLAGDAWRRRPYLPMSHMEALHRLLNRPNSANPLSFNWFFMVSDRTFVNVPQLLRVTNQLETSSKGYYGQVAEASHKESFGFHTYVDINGGVLLSSALMHRVSHPEACIDQKDAAGTYDMFDAKLGNCVFYLGARAQTLPGFGAAGEEACPREGQPPFRGAPSPRAEVYAKTASSITEKQATGAAVEGDEREEEGEEGEEGEASAPNHQVSPDEEMTVMEPELDLNRSERAPHVVLSAAVTASKVDPAEMVRLSVCAGLMSAEDASKLTAWEASQRYPLNPQSVAVHVMARETQLMPIVESCEATWGVSVNKLYYHVDRVVAAENFAISRGRWGISANLVAGGDTPAKTSSFGQPVISPLQHALGRPYSAMRGKFRHRVAALNLPERPSTQGEHWTVSHDKGMTWNTWLRFKMRAIYEYSVRAHWAEIRETEWLVYVDDDTYVLWEPLLELLSRYDPRTAHYFGRPLHEAGYPLFVGGGAGIVLSRAAADQIAPMLESEACDPLHLKWADRMHSGGDAWLGDCAENAGVHTDMEFGFYPQPPVSNLFALFNDAVAFHGVENHAAMHAALSANSSETAYDPRCVPVFVDHKYNCLPHFIIGGVPKAGTTSLYKYLIGHPDVLPAEDKELTFWGNFFSPKRRPGRDEVMTTYLTRFPKISPSDFKVTGEATPGYLFCITCPTYMLKYMPKVRLIFTLRNPVPRAYSEYLNKVADRTVMRYLTKRINNKMEKELSDNAPPFEALVDDVARTMGSCGSPNRTFSMMDEYTAEMDEAGCYVNPFVGEGRYARYLRLWLGMVPKRQMMILNFDVWTASDAAAKATMAEVAGFLQLAHFAFRVSEAHNTHANRSVHVDRDAVTDAAQIKAQAVEAELSTRIRCILNDFFQPFNEDLDHLLAHYGYSPMTHTWQSGSGCPPESLWRFAEVLLAAPHAGEVSREDEEHKKCGTVDHPCLAGSDFHVNY